MAKKRFRDVKQGKDKEIVTEKPQPEEKWNYASAGMKIKAFLTDSFMLVMPIMYVVFYLIMGGREGFAAHKAMGWLYILVPLVIAQTIFMFKTDRHRDTELIILLLLMTSQVKSLHFLSFFLETSLQYSLFLPFLAGS